jgi:hypothetical protein
MQSFGMLFSSAKTGHMGQILSTGVLGEVIVNHFAPPSPDQVQAWGAMIIQALVAVVTIWATIRKALQKPETVVKVPAATVAVTAPMMDSVQPTSPTAQPHADTTE